MTGLDPANPDRPPIFRVPGTPKGDRKMPKMKTKSSAKKRFRFTASGKIKHGQAGKRHGMIKRSNEQIRELRGTSTMSASETQRVKRWMPYAF
jgi:large subunit ribosomal protein L35